MIQDNSFSKPLSSVNGDEINRLLTMPHAQYLPYILIREATHCYRAKLKRDWA